MHLFGTGHSRIAVEEMFPRYGSYPGFHPIVELSMTFHTQVVGANGQRQAMFIERMEGLASILRNFELGPPDAMMVFSAGGRGAVPIEMARGARERGLAVIAITSVDAWPPGDTHSSGTRLRDHADVVLDLRTPPARRTGDDRGPGHARRSGLDDRCRGARERSQGSDRGSTRGAGAMPPVITSAASWARESRRLFDAAYAEHARRAARVLGGCKYQRRRRVFVPMSLRARNIALLAVLVGVLAVVAAGCGGDDSSSGGTASSGGGKKMYKIGVSNTLVGNGSARGDDLLGEGSGPRLRSGLRGARTQRQR